MSKFATKENLNEMYQKILPYLGGNSEAGFTPIGTIISVMGVTTPVHYLACDGTVYNINSYPELADYFKSQFGSKNYFGGNGITTFAVPDLRGEFLRGTGTNGHLISGTTEKEGSGSDVGQHQGATLNPLMCFSYTQNQLQCAVYNNGDTSGWKYATNTDREFGPKTYVIANTSTKGSDEYAGSYTSRPTNTSVLYCIATKNIYLNPSLDYSTSEKVVGTWIDGKPLYQRTFVKTGGVTNATMYFQNEFSDVDFIMKKDVVFRTNSLNGAWESEYSRGETDVLQVLIIDGNTDRGVFPIIGNTRTVSEMYVTVQYTKTTD